MDREFDRDPNRGDFGMNLDRWYICSDHHYRTFFWWVFPPNEHREAFGGPQQFRGSAEAFAACRAYGDWLASKSVAQ